MKSTEPTNKVSRELLASLNAFVGDNQVIGPKGDNYHHFESISVIKGDDHYNITGVVEVTDEAVKTLNTNFTTRAARFRGMSGVSIVFLSEDGYRWSKNLFFHKGIVFEENIILDDHVEFGIPNETADSVILASL